MDDPGRIVGHVSGGRVLDVATGRGGFIEFLRSGLKDYTEIIGIDSSDAGATAFAESFGDVPDIRFVRMDALRPAFPGASFDTVCISNSLHHFADPGAILRQMLRLLRPGGTFIISEMYRDGQSEAQMTHVLLHHWWAAVDTSEGIVHRQTYRRAELVDLVASLRLADVRLTDRCDTGRDPREPEAVAELDGVIERYLERSAGNPELVARGTELRRRLREVGVHGATTLVVVARKQGRAPSADATRPSAGADGLGFAW